MDIYEDTGTGKLYSFSSYYSEYNQATIYTAQNEVRADIVPDTANALPAGDLSGYSAPDSVSYTHLTLPTICSV